MTVRDALSVATATLSSEIESPRREARLLLTLVADFSLAKQLKSPEKKLSDDQVRRYFALVTRRSKGEPFAYLAGSQAFYGRSFEVGKGVLVPRPETEQLVSWWLEQIVALLKSGALPPELTILDIATGSGCIGLTIAQELRKLAKEDARFKVKGLYLTDISETALDYARKNVRLIDPDIFVSIEKADLLPAYWPHPDLVFSNPPYIDMENDREVDSSVLAYEPRLALAAGEDGMDVFKRLASRLPQVATKPFYLGLEHGYTQATLVKDVFQRAGFDVFSSMTDYNGYERGQWLFKSL